MLKHIHNLWGSMCTVLILLYCLAYSAAFPVKYRIDKIPKFKRKIYIFHETKNNKQNELQQ